MSEACKANFLENTACKNCDNCLETAIWFIKDLRHRPVCDLMPREYFCLQTALFVAHYMMGHDNFETLRTGNSKYNHGELL